MPSNITAADHGGAVPATSISCPIDDEKVKAQDIRGPVAALLANDGNLGTTKVAKSGDTMTGKLTVSPSGASAGAVALNVVAGGANDTAVQGTGSGSGFGGGFIGGATGAGLIAQAGGGNAAGGKFQGAGTGPDVEYLAGPALFSGTQPASSANPGKNRLHATNVVKAWAVIETDGLGGATILDGFNAASATAVSATLTLNLAEPVNTNYGVSVDDMTTPVSATARTFGSNKSANTGSAVKVFGRTITSGSVANIDFATEVVVVYVEVMGRQT